MDPRIVHIVRAARKGGKVLKRYFGESLETTVKSTLADFRTRADTESEEEILRVLKAEFPDYGYYSEETGKDSSNSQYTFVIDPLDGTNNFATGLPTFSVSIALLHRGVALLGVVYCPFLEGAYYAQRGIGAFFDGAPLSASQETDMSKSAFAVSAGYKTDRDYEIDCHVAFQKRNPKRVMHEWSTAYCLCLLAAGRIEGMISNGAEIYDFAAGKLIAEEAGAIVTDFDGQQEHDEGNDAFVVGCTEEIHNELLKVCTELKK
jgi:myo-inositol-1(or 4)-monophosphatase